MNKVSFFSLFAIVLMLGASTVLLWPEDAEARRFGGGASMGSRGARSFSPPRRVTSPPRNSTARRNTAPQSSAAATPGRSGMGSDMGAGLMGGIGGLVLGGMLGSMLFGGGESVGHAAGAAGGMGGSGIGLFEILLLGGVAWFAFRWFKRRKAGASAPSGGMYGTSQEAMAAPFGAGGGAASVEATSGAVAGGGQVNEIEQGLENIASMDPSFDERQFLEGAKMAFQQIQGAWSDWSVDRLRPLLTPRMWEMIHAQAETRKAEGKRDIIEKIRFDEVVISEAWQESGEDWITVHFLVDMVDYTADVAGAVLEGDPNTSSKVEEYWTFNRPVGSQDPNWFLAAIQQPGEVARSVR